MKIIKRDDEYIILLSGSEMRHLEMGHKIKNKEFTIMMDFGSGKEERANQVSPSHLKESK